MLDGEQVYLEGHKVIKPFKGQMGVSLNGGTRKTPQNDHF